MGLRHDDRAASPLVVITTFVLVAVLITIAVYALVFDRPKPELQVVQDRDASGALTLVVSRTAGGLEWKDVQLQFLDRAGTDLGSTYLHPPDGHVDRQDRIPVSPEPPSGTYILRAMLKGNEVSRQVVVL